MADTARRTRDGQGSDIVRRLIARPIRREADSRASSGFEDAGEAAHEGAELASAEGRFDQMYAEMAIMKAALADERRRSESLRAHVHLRAGPEPIGDEARAVRDRWAGLVDDLLRATA